MAINKRSPDFDLHWRDKVVSMRLAVMQPYFFPYLGYYRLFDRADTFVVFDNVQFPRRGWVHRNRGQLSGHWSWVTLPLQKAPRESLISDLQFRSGDLPAWVQKQKQVLNSVSEKKGMLVDDLPWPAVGELPIDYLVRSLSWMVDLLGLECTLIRSSELATWPPECGGDQKILDLCRQLEAEEYVNSPGGEALYASDDFEAQGTKLTFLPPYKGSVESVLFRLVREGADGLRSAYQTESFIDQ